MGILETVRKVEEHLERIDKRLAHVEEIAENNAKWLRKRSEWGAREHKAASAIFEANQLLIAGKVGAARLILADAISLWPVIGAADVEWSPSGPLKAESAMIEGVEVPLNRITINPDGTVSVDPAVLEDLIKRGAFKCPECGKPWETNDDEMAYCPEHGPREAL